MAILISFLELCLYIAFVCFIAYVILWVIRSFFGWQIDANVYKFGQIIVALICPDRRRSVARWLDGRWPRSATLLVLPISESRGWAICRRSHRDRQTSCRGC